MMTIVSDALRSNKAIYNKAFTCWIAWGNIIFFMYFIPFFKFLEMVQLIEILKN